MITCDNCGKPVGEDFIRIRTEGVYYKMAKKLGLPVYPDLCSVECLQEYIGKIKGEK